MAVFDQAGKAAADAIAQGAENVAGQVVGAEKDLVQTGGAALADAVSDVVGALDRMTAMLDRQATAGLAESAAWRKIPERFVAFLERIKLTP